MTAEITELTSRMHVNTNTVAAHKVGSYAVSTVERRAHLTQLDNMLAVLSEMIGLDDRADLATPGRYETMVFPWDDVRGGVTDFAEIDFARYQTVEEALEGHAAMVEKWAEMPAGIARSRGDALEDPETT